jgi:hypothetical protein
MTKVIENTRLPKLLPYNWVSILAKECNCTTMWVRLAVRYGHTGPKADLVRKAFNEKWGDITNEKT